MVARDDGSTDETTDVLREYQKRFPDRVHVIEDRRCRLGACQNFARLLEESTAPYIAFADQDDVWMPDKLERLLERMRSLEERFGADEPLLVHSDLEVIDDSGRVLGGSFWKYQAIRPDVAGDWRRLMVQNVVTGCAAMINGALRDLARPIPAEAIMHDWWLALVAARFGAIGYVRHATVRYRQHKGNDKGAKRWGVGYIGRQTVAALSGKLRKSLRETQRQAAAFGVRYGEMLSAGDREVIDGYVRLEEKGLVERRLFLVRHRLLKTGVVRSVGWLLIV